VNRKIQIDLKSLSEFPDLSNSIKNKKIFIREKDNNAAREDIRKIGNEDIKIKKDKKIVLK
jgi:hypothetical protein